MKKEDLPQDKSKLSDFTREILYVKNKEGKYNKELSSGWDVKSEALKCAWDEVERRVANAKIEIKAGRKSPVYYFMELHLMDVQILSSYTGFWSFSINRHLIPKVFQKLSIKKLEVYAKLFKVTVDELKNFDGYSE